VLLLLALVALLVLDSPANEIAFGILFALGLGELWFWWRTVRNRKVQTGAETIVGSEAKVLSACRPDGEVWFEGARWQASCPEGADAGDVVTVVERRELRLIVASPRKAEGGRGSGRATAAEGL
jgi:membrane-bound ClpP family serine protease